LTRRDFLKEISLRNFAWLRHPTFQRIFDRVDGAEGADLSLESPPNAITSSNWEYEQSWGDPGTWPVVLCGTGTVLTHLKTVVM
jgi:hypothetical protein